MRWRPKATRTSTTTRAASRTGSRPVCLPRAGEQASGGFVGEGSGEHRTRSVSFEGEEDRLAGFFALPEGEGPFPGVVVIHEAFGLNENIRDVARRFAAHGYAAFAVDLFAGRNRAVCTARFMGGMLRGKPRPFGVGDLERALSVLGEQPGVDAERLGAIGFCMGGGYALAWACNDDRLKAIAPYYGANPRPLAAVARSCPVVGSYPEKDFTALSARKLDAELARHDIPRDIKIYPGARHSFFNDRGRAYDPAAAEDPGAARSPSSPSTSASNEPSHQPVLAARFRLCVYNFCEYIS